jgi:tryptophan synthase alpha chain
MIESYIRDRKKNKNILLMTHIVIGYPDLDSSYEIVKAMVANGVDLMELQIPFSEPIADGPVILNANQVALEHGIKVADCIDFAARVAKDFSIPFLFMSYFNVVFKYGVQELVSEMKKINIKGAIVPDLPPEEGADYFAAMDAEGLSPILLFSPTTPDDRLVLISKCARGFVYCIARKGVTGLSTEFSHDIDQYIARCRNATNLPLALGFGVKDRKDIEFLTGKVDIAIIGTQSIRAFEAGGIPGLSSFLKSIG